MERKNSFNQNKFSVHQKIVRLVGKRKRVLDVGCSEGIISERLKMNECEVVGIELDEASAQIAKYYCRDVFLGDVEILELDEKFENYFDFIIFADVLEHLRDPESVLRRFKRYLKDEGSVVISIPNVANWRMRINLLFGNFDYVDHGLLNKGHIRFFNVRSAKNLIKNAGFEVVKFDLTVGDLDKFATFFYRIGTLFPNLLAFQFLIVAKGLLKNNED